VRWPVRDGLGTAVLSRGLEEQANFSTQAARAATETVVAYRIVTACELVAAVRGLRMRGVVPAPGPLLDAYGWPRPPWTAGPPTGRWTRTSTRPSACCPHWAPG
jgi:hypothetical protein